MVQRYFGGRVDVLNRRGDAQLGAWLGSPETWLPASVRGPDEGFSAVSGPCPSCTWARTFLPPRIRSALTAVGVGTKKQQQQKKNRK